MPLLSNKTIIGIKQESTQNTAVSLTATDYILASDVDIKVNAEILERDYKRTSLDRLAHVIGKRSVSVSFKTELKGSGTAGTAYDPMSAAIEACGFLHTDGASTNSYAPTSTTVTNFFGPGKSATILVNKDGILHTVAGCLGSFKISCEAGKIAMIEFKFDGIYAAPSDTAAASQTYNSTLPPIVASASLALGGYASHIASKFEIDSNNKVEQRADVSSAAGVKGYIIVGRDPQGSIDPEAVALSTDNIWTDFINGTETSTSIVVGATAGNVITITCPKTQYSDVGYADRSGIISHNANLKFNQTTADDWCSIVFS